MTLVRTLLIIEDNPGDVRLLCEMLAEDEARQDELIHVGTMSDAEAHLASHSVDVILLDLGLPDSQGLDAIRRIRTAAPHIPLVVLTGLDDDDLANLSLQHGAQDYLVKGQIDTRSLLRTLRYASERKRLEKLKDEFVSTVSHELRTPLTSITASLGLLVGGASGIPAGPAMRLLTIAHSNCKRLVRLINDILDIEKLESGRMVFDLKRTEVRSLVEEAIEANEAMADNHGIILRLERATSSALAHVRADADRLSQVVTNLLSNAIKFSERGDEVVVAVETEADLIRISVRDHGSGIPAEFRSHIFERFAQADATDTRLKGGTGLGLYIVRNIVNQLGGEVSFLDRLGGGTVFSIELPRWDGMADHLREEQKKADEVLESESSLESLVEQARDCMPEISADRSELA